MQLLWTNNTWAGLYTLTFPPWWSQFPQYLKVARAGGAALHIPDQTGQHPIFTTSTWLSIHSHGWRDKKLQIYGKHAYRQISLPHMFFWRAKGRCTMNDHIAKQVRLQI